MNIFEKEYIFYTDIKLCNHKLINCFVQIKVEISNGFIGAKELIKKIVINNLIRSGIESNDVNIISNITKNKIIKELYNFNIVLIDFIVKDSDFI